MSPDIPLTDPVYDRVSRLEAKGFFPEDLHAVRPLTEGQLRRLFVQALESGGDAAGDPDILAIEQFLRRLNLGREEAAPGGGEVEVRGGIWATNSRSEPILEVDANVNPLLEQREGRWGKGGVAGWLEPRFAMRWGGWGSLDLTPRLPLQWSPEGGGASFDGELFSGVLKLGYGGVETRIGRFPLRFGHGRSGSLILGGSNPPLDGIELRNAYPSRLPWIFRHLGPAQFSLVVARLDGEQSFPHSLFVSERLSIRPSRWFEAGFAQTVILGGKGSSDISFLDGLAEVLGKRKGNIYESNYSNRNFLFDFRVVVPPLHALAIYSEVFFEDCCGGRWLRDISNLVGISLPALGGDRTSLTFEWVRTTEITYRNGRFQSGFEHRHHLLGHPIGPDAMGFYFFSDTSFTGDLWVTARMGLERRGREGKNQGSDDIRTVYADYEVPENRLLFAVEPKWELPGGLFLGGGLGYEWVKTFRFVRADTRHNVLGEVSAALKF